MMNERPVILVVDDEEPIVDALEAWLTMAGYSVMTARKGRDAVEQAKQKSPAVAVVDLLLDDMPGLAVMNEIHRFSPNTECIVVTGQAPEESAQAATELTAYGYLMKPCHPDQLLLLIRRALEHGKTKKALHESGLVIDELLERLPGAALILNGNRKIQALNPRATDLLGKESEVLMGSRISDHLSAETAADVAGHLQATAKSRAATEFDAVFGDTPRRVNVRPLKETNGQVALLAVYVDAARTDSSELLSDPTG